MLALLPILGVALAVLAVATRLAHLRAPLHMDTAYYVAPASVRAGAPRLRSGWNAHFSGGSRLLPEAVHTALYLRVGRDRYAAAFRALYVVLNLCGTLAAGAFVSLAVGPALGAIAAGVVAVWTSDGLFQAHHETAEAFALPLQATGVLLFAAALLGGPPVYVTLGALLLSVDTLFVKLTGGPVAVAVGVVVLATQPTAAPWMIAGVLPVVVGWGWWIASLPLRPGQLISHLRLHEAFTRRTYRSVGHSWKRRLGLVAKTMARGPLIPAALFLAAAAATPRVAGDPVTTLAVAWALGAAIGWAVQGNRVVYFMLPMLPPAVAIVLVSGPPDALVVGVAGAALLHAMVMTANAWRRSGRDQLLHTFRLWGPGMPDGAVATTTACRAWRARVGSDTALVVGPYNQAYAELSTAWPTPLVALCELADRASGGLERFLTEPLAAEPPRWLIDTGDALGDYTERFPVFRTYTEVDAIDGVRLLRADAVASPSPPAVEPSA